MKITQSSGFLLSLLKEVASGRTLPAAMQRPYVWGREDVEALCDSIISGFPIGSFLLWSPALPFDLKSLAKTRLGPLTAASVDKTSRLDPYQLLLDGQNRLATMAWMMHRDFKNVPPAAELSVPESVTWTDGYLLVLDYETKSIRFMQAREANQGLRLPAWTLLPTPPGTDSANSLVRHLWDGAWKDYPEAERNAFMKVWDDAYDKFTSARVTATYIEEATPEEARHAFLRICKVGVPMSKEDFDNAIGWSARNSAETAAEKDVRRSKMLRK